MAEIGLIASVIQVAGAGLKLSQTLYQYADTVASADRRVKDIAKEVQLTSFVIDELGHIFKHDQTSALLSDNAIKTADETVRECSSVFTELDAAIKKTKKRTIGKLMLPFREPKIELLRSHIDKLKSTLQLLMQVLTHAHQVASQKLDREAEAAQREQIKLLLQNKKDSTKRYEESLRNYRGSDNDEDGDKEHRDRDLDLATESVMTAASLSSTITTKSLKTCVLHIQSLLEDIETLQQVLADDTEGTDPSEHHQSLIGSYFRARGHLDTILLGNPDGSRDSMTESVSASDQNLAIQKTLTGSTLQATTSHASGASLIQAYDDGNGEDVLKSPHLQNALNKAIMRAQEEARREEREKLSQTGKKAERKALETKGRAEELQGRNGKAQEEPRRTSASYLSDIEDDDIHSDNTRIPRRMRSSRYNDADGDPPLDSALDVSYPPSGSRPMQSMRSDPTPSRSPTYNYPNYDVPSTVIIESSKGKRRQSYDTTQGRRSLRYPPPMQSNHSKHMPTPNVTIYNTTRLDNESNPSHTYPRTRHNEIASPEFAMVESIENTESEEEANDRALMPPRKINRTTQRRPSLRHANTTQVYDANRRVPQSQALAEHPWERSPRSSQRTLATPIHHDRTPLDARESRRRRPRSQSPYDFDDPLKNDNDLDRLLHHKRWLKRDPNQIKLNGIVAELRFASEMLRVEALNKEARSDYETRSAELRTRRRELKLERYQIHRARRVSEKDEPGLGRQRGEHNIASKREHIATLPPKSDTSFARRPSFDDSGSVRTRRSQNGRPIRLVNEYALEDELAELRLEVAKNRHSRSQSTYYHRDDSPDHHHHEDDRWQLQMANERLKEAKEELQYDERKARRRTQQVTSRRSYIATRAGEEDARQAKLRNVVDEVMAYQQRMRGSEAPLSEKVYKRAKRSSMGEVHDERADELKITSQDDWEDERERRSKASRGPSRYDRSVIELTGRRRSYKPSAYYVGVNPRSSVEFEEDSWHTSDAWEDEKHQRDGHRRPRPHTQGLPQEPIESYFARLQIGVPAETGSRSENSPKMHDYKGKKGKAKAEQDHTSSTTKRRTREQERKRVEEHEDEWEREGEKDRILRESEKKSPLVPAQQNPPNVQSAEYNELIQKNCFFGTPTGKGTPPASPAALPASYPAASEVSYAYGHPAPHPPKKFNAGSAAEFLVEDSPESDHNDTPHGVPSSAIPRIEYNVVPPAEREEEVLRQGELAKKQPERKSPLEQQQREQEEKEEALRREELMKRRLELKYVKDKQEREGVETELKIWEAARAISAAPRIFKPFHHEPSKQEEEETRTEDEVEELLRKWTTVLDDERGKGGVSLYQDID